MSDENLIRDEKSLELASRAITSIEKAEVRKEELTPVDIVENSVANFLGKVIDATVESNKLSAALEQSLIDDLDEMSTAEKITLFNIERSSSNDKWFKILSPSIGLITARQQAIIQGQAKEAAQAAAVQVNVNSSLGNSRDAAVASATSPEVNSGLNTIFQLINARSEELKAAKENADSAIEVEIEDSEK